VEIETHVGAGVTVVNKKLAQSADRTEAGLKPSRVPVMARLQLLPAQARASKTLATAAETRDRIATAFIANGSGVFGISDEGLLASGSTAIERQLWTIRRGDTGRERREEAPVFYMYLGTWLQI